MGKQASRNFPSGGMGLQGGQPGGMQAPRMMMNRPMIQHTGPYAGTGGPDPIDLPQTPPTQPGQTQPPQNEAMSQMFSKVGGYGMQPPTQGQQFSAGGGDPVTDDLARQRAALSGQGGRQQSGSESYSSTLGGAPQITQNPNMGTGGGSPFEPAMLAQALGAPSQVQTGGGSPYQPDPPQGNSGGMGALRGFGPNGAGGYIDPFAGWTTGPETRTPPSHPAPPMGSQLPPDWLAQNPQMGKWLGGGANSWGTLNGRGPWSWNRG